MNTQQPILAAEQCHRWPCMSWSAIFAGAFVGMGLGFLLHLYGIAIGLSAYSATAEGATMIAIGGVIGLLLGVIVSMGLAGFVAGYLGRYHHCACHGGIVYGFLTWSMALLLSATFIVPLTYYVTAYTHDLAPGIEITKPIMHAMSDDVATNHEAKAPHKNKLLAVKTTPTDNEALTWSAWIVFGMFFIGALSSCIGACCGMCCRRHQEGHSLES